MMKFYVVFQKISRIVFFTPVFVLYATVIYLTGGLVASAVASPAPPWGNGTHSHGRGDLKGPDSRNYARTFANANVGEPRTVRLIYFLPNDWEYRASVVQNMKDTIRTVQTFYTEQMEAHGYGRVTFRFETDAPGEPMVHRVDGQHPFSHYDNTLGTAVLSELQETYDFDANIYFIVLGTDALRQGNGAPASGVAVQYTKNGGSVLVPNDFSWGTVAHELGHTFGLNHDFRDGAYIMSYGPGEDRLSVCAAEFLSVHPYFNPAIPIEEGKRPSIELISSPLYPAGSQSVPVRFKVHDSDGLHQVILFAITRRPHFSAGHPEVKACYDLAGDRDTVVEFDYDSVVPSAGWTSLSDRVVHPIRVEVVDKNGDVGYASFRLVEISPYHIATLEGHTYWVDSVSFSPDGRTLASGAQDRTVKLWDVTTQTNFATLAHTTSAGNNARVTSVSFSPDGTILASGTSVGTVKLWDVTTQTNFATLAHTGWVNSVSFSPDGTTLASGTSDGTVELWDVTTRTNFATLEVEKYTGWVFSVSFSPDGETLASGTGQGYVTVNLWDVATRANIATLWRHTDQVTSVSFSPDGTTLASGTSDGTIELWDMSMLMGARLEATAEIDIPDPNLRAAIEDALGKASGATIITAEMANLTELDASNANISDLTGLEAATNLTELTLGSIAITDLSPVAGLTNLTYLHLGGNAITDLSPVAGLTNLKFLYLGYNNISDITALRGLTNLIYLYLWGNNITDISPLVANTGFGSGDGVVVGANPLSFTSINTHIPALQSRGVEVGFSNLKPLTLEYTLSIPADTSLIHVPLRVTAVDGVAQPLESISDLYDALGGAAAVNFLITYDNTTQGWLSYFGVSDSGTLADRVLTDDMGIIAGMKTPTSVRLTGNPLGTNSSSTITLTPGQNLVGLPLRDSSLNRVSDLLNLDGIRGNVPVIILSDGGDFKLVGQAGDPGDIPLTGGGAFIMTAQRAATVTLSGEGWTNVSDTAASPSVVFRGIESSYTTPVLALRGAIVDEQAGLTGPSFRVTVKNLSTGRTVVGMTQDEGAGYRLTHVDIETGRAATIGDTLEISAQLPNPFIGVQPVRYTVTAEDVKRSLIQLPELLAYEIPTETELLQNYPNPFNPETWIPYRLAEDTFVTLIIYDNDGRVVRSLDVGHRGAMVYESRSKAIYWDGRNEFGETVASGVYFYHLSVGDYSATRKMIILK